MERNLKELKGKHRLFLALLYANFIALAVSIALSVVYKEIAVAFRICLAADVAFTFIIFKLASQCGKYKKKIMRARAENGELTKDAVLRQILVSYYGERSTDENNGIEFYCGVSKDGKISSCVGYLWGDYTNMDVDFSEGKMRVNIDAVDYYTDEPIEREVEYAEASPEPTLDGVTRFLKEYYDGYNARSIGYISNSWVAKVLVNAADEKTLKKNNIIGKKGSIFNACALFGTTYVFGRDAAAAYDKIENKNGYVFIADDAAFSGGFAKEITEADTGAALMENGKFLAVDKDYNWSFISDGKTAYFITDVKMLRFSPIKR